MKPASPALHEDVTITAGDGVMLNGILSVPPEAGAIILFAHGSGSSRFSSRNQFVARTLNQSHLATLLFDLLTADEEEVDQFSREFRFDIDLLAERLTGAVDWVRQQEQTRNLRMGLFGSSTGAAAALIAAAERPRDVGAVVSRGGRPDLAGRALDRVLAPTLLIVGGDDVPVIELNREAKARLRGECRLEIVPHATHLFEEPGKLEEVARLTAQWFLHH